MCVIRVRSPTLATRIANALFIGGLRLMFHSIAAHAYLHCFIQAFCPLYNLMSVPPELRSSTLFQRYCGTLMPLCSTNVSMPCKLAVSCIGSGSRRS